MLKVNQDTYARVFASLLMGPATTHELVLETGLHVVTMQSLMRCLKNTRSCISSRGKKTASAATARRCMRSASVGISPAPR